MPLQFLDEHTDRHVGWRISQERHEPAGKAIASYDYIYLDVVTVAVLSIPKGESSTCRAKFRQTTMYCRDVGLKKKLFSSVLIRFGRIQVFEHPGFQRWLEYLLSHQQKAAQFWSSDSFMGNHQTDTYRYTTSSWRYLKIRICHGRFFSPRIDRRVVLLRSICECIPARPEAPTDPGGCGAAWDILGHLGSPKKTPTKWSHHDIMILKKHLRMKFGWFDSVRRNWRYCGLCGMIVCGFPSKKKSKREGNVGNTGSAGKWQSCLNWVIRSTHRIVTLHTLCYRFFGSTFRNLRNFCHQNCCQNAVV